MPASRRRFLVCLGLVPLASCAPDPTIVGGPDSLWSPEPTEPAQSDAARTAGKALAELIGGVAFTRAAAPTWEPVGDVGQWADPVLRMCRSQLDRLLSEDVFSEPDPIFDAPDTAEPDLGSSESEADAWLNAAVARQVETFRDLALAAPTQADALLHTSLALSSIGILNKNTHATAGSAVPIRFPEVSARSSHEVALTHCWALLRGLEVGLGRLEGSDPLANLGTARVASARFLRNHLRDELDQVPEQDLNYELPTPMSNVGEIRQGWGVLEEHLLDALARLFVTSRDVEWFELALEQVRYVHAAGRQLNYWPGWVAT